ncbi:PDDEXK nuclease domain-containing protein [Acetobacterium malicum]|uniref:PDDEXK nuclease domain-containing protein n=1 Tax=Acetobacterium malicum TaxID=52692 RepID=UPI00040061BD|nr:PDDEXK nuclease domain-containing protein [Acetobacterium dehalogenans]
MSELQNQAIINEIRQILQSARENVARAVNNELLFAYWNIGKIIVENEQAGSEKAEYGKQLLKSLSKELTRELGKGFSRSNLQNMRLLYLSYPICQSLSGKLSFTHYCELFTVSDKNARSFYEQEALNSNWSVREMKRQIDTSLFERMLLSEGKTNKEKVLMLAKEGIVYRKPNDILKDPYVFEFLGIPENKPMLEKDLEKALIIKIENFLLELGRGFMFVGSQQRITLGNTHYYVDMVFYNKILKAYVLIDLKMGSLKPENIGQMNMYVNYYASEVNDEDDEKPMGIILCADTSEIVAEYALGGLENQIFASKYVYYIPNKQELIEQVQSVLNEIGEKNKKILD